MSDVHIHIHTVDDGAAILRKLDRIEHLLRAGQAQESKAMSDLDNAIADLQAKVEAETTVEQSAITLLNGLPGLIQDAFNKGIASGATAQELNALTELSKKISDSTAALTTAVTANTPAGTTKAPSDTPVGGAGSDSVAAGTGGDSVTGGAGADTTPGSAAPTV